MKINRLLNDGLYRADIVGIRHPDAEFIAHARTDVPALLAEVERLRIQVEAKSFVERILAARLCVATEGKGEA